MSDLFISYLRLFTLPFKPAALHENIFNNCTLYLFLLFLLILTPLLTFCLPFTTDWTDDGVLEGTFLLVAENPTYND